MPQTQDQQVRSSKIKAAAPRYKITQDTDKSPLMIQSRTLGVPVEFMLTSDNISRSGILMENRSLKKIPFNVNTLLELTIDPERAWLQKPVQCLAKVVRLNRSPGTAEQYGIRIVQMDEQDNTIWEQCFKQLEKSAAHLLMVGTPADAGKKNQPM